MTQEMYIFEFTKKQYAIEVSGVDPRKLLTAVKFQRKMLA